MMEKKPFEQPCCALTVRPKEAKWSKSQPGILLMAEFLLAGFPSPFPSDSQELSRPEYSSKAEGGKAVSFISKLACSFCLQNDCQCTPWSRLTQGFLGLNTSELQSGSFRVEVLI